MRSVQSMKTLGRMLPKLSRPCALAVATLEEDTPVRLNGRNNELLFKQAHFPFELKIHHANNAITWLEI